MEILHWINIGMDIQPEIVYVFGVPGLLLYLVLPVMKYFMDGI